MQNLQKVKVTIEKGKVSKKEKIGKERPVADSIAEDLIIEGKEALNKDVVAKIQGIKIFEIWEEGSKLKQTDKTATE